MRRWRKRPRLRCGINNIIIFFIMINFIIIDFIIIIDAGDDDRRVPHRPAARAPDRAVWQQEGERGRADLQLGWLIRGLGTKMKTASIGSQQKIRILQDLPTEKLSFCHEFWHLNRIFGQNEGRSMEIL